jgi:hypothetical protein
MSGYDIPKTGAWCYMLERGDLCIRGLGWGKVPGKWREI